jgi:hypothetical protein
MWRSTVFRERKSLLCDLRSRGTVRKDLDNVFAKLGVDSGTAAATLVCGGL